jgi:hypothetical protein
LKKINVVLCGMRFGAAFVPIYRDHPDVESVGICDTNPEKLEQTRQSLGLPPEAAFTDYEALLDSGLVDAVSVTTPNNMHIPAAMAEKSFPSPPSNTFLIFETSFAHHCMVPYSYVLLNRKRIKEI